MLQDTVQCHFRPGQRQLPAMVARRFTVMEFARNRLRPSRSDLHQIAEVHALCHPSRRNAGPSDASHTEGRRSSCTLQQLRIDCHCSRLAASIGMGFVSSGSPDWASAAAAKDGASPSPSLGMLNDYRAIGARLQPQESSPVGPCNIDPLRRMLR